MPTPQEYAERLQLEIRENAQDLLIKAGAPQRSIEYDDGLAAGLEAGISAALVVLSRRDMIQLPPITFEAAR